METYNTLMPKTAEPSPLYKLTTKRQTSTRNDTNVRLCIQQATLALGQATASTTPHSPRSSTIQAAEPASKETLAEYSVDHKVGDGVKTHDYNTNRR